MSNNNKSNRIIQLDATRGAAMLAVCLSHSAAFVDSSHQTFAASLSSIGMVATPTFLLLSGLVCGYLARLQEDTPEKFRWRLIDRGLFLLLVAHLALGLVHGIYMPLMPALTSSFYITDAVGVGLIVAGLIAQRASPVRLAACGLLLLIASWIISNIHQPSAGLARALLRILVGAPDADHHDEGYVVPLIPYLGIFMIGMAAGIEYMRQRRDGRMPGPPAALFIRVGVMCMLAAVALKLTWLMAKPLMHSHWQVLYRLCEPREKLPPGPAYVLGYGGAGAILTGIIGKIATFRRGEGLVALLATVGRASLVVFVAQYLLYSVPTQVLHAGIGWWPLLFPLSLLALLGIAWSWDRFNGNRLFTVGARKNQAAAQRRTDTG